MLDPSRRREPRSAGACPEVWKAPATSELLADTLGFLAEDDYAFHFNGHAGHWIEASIPFQDFGADDAWRPGEVIMFQGGLCRLPASIVAGPTTPCCISGNTIRCRMKNAVGCRLGKTANPARKRPEEATAS